MLQQISATTTTVPTQPSGSAAVKPSETTSTTTAPTTAGTTTVTQTSKATGEGSAPAAPLASPTSGSGGSSPAALSTFAAAATIAGPSTSPSAVGKAATTGALSGHNSDEVTNADGSTSVSPVNGVTFTRNADGTRCRAVRDDDGHGTLLEVLIGSGCHSQDTHRNPLGGDASHMVISIGSSANSITTGGNGRNAKASCIAIRGDA
ncbi:MAG: hypothetical protein Q8L11_04205, partial [Candidatus Moranbacteria bacterium]|nr:hypothetical protein [Candidatus Moranbacteria bacterium]